MRPPPPSRAFLGQAISASRSSSPTSSATPSWVNTPHPPPFLLPSLRDTLLTLTPPRSLCSDVSLTFPALLHLQVWLHCPPSPPARSLCAPSTPPQLRPPLSPALGSPSWPSPWTSRSLLAAWAPERSSEASRASSARPRRGSHSCAMTCCPRRAPGLEPLAVGGVSRAGAGKPTAAHAHCRPARSGATSPREEGFEAPGSPEAPFAGFWRVRRLSCLPTRSLEGQQHSTTLPRPGRPPTGSRGATENGGRWDTREGGTLAGGGAHLAGRGGHSAGAEDRHLARQPAPGTAPGSWEEEWLALTPPPTGPCGRGGSAEPSRLSVWALAAMSLHLRACAATTARDTNFLETCGFLPALL